MLSSRNFSTLQVEINKLCYFAKECGWINNRHQLHVAKCSGKKTLQKVVQYILCSFKISVANLIVFKGTIAWDGFLA